MSFDTMEQAYKQLNAEQQQAIYNLTILLLNNNENQQSKPKKRTFGQYAGRAKAVFADNWEMTDEELCSL
ncbi:MAG: hypothetical protein K6F33_12950 [Bacteroidales bacterium]|nr:hypothetical protein [Bacteroidales bacterium]